MCDEDVHLTSKKNRRPSTREQSTRGEVDRALLYPSPIRIRVGALSLSVAIMSA